MLIGDLALVGAALTWASYSVLIRKITRKWDVLSVCLIAFIWGRPVSIPSGVWEVSVQGAGYITPCVIAGVLCIGIISTALAMYLWIGAFTFLYAGVAS